MLAGMPKSLASHIAQPDLRRAAGDGGFLVLKETPDNIGWPHYSVEYVNRVVASCRRWIEKRDVDEKFSVSLIYANDGGAGARMLVSKFHPFCLVADFYPLAIPGTSNERGRVVGEFIPRLQAICSSLRSRGKVMFEHMQSAMRRTPLLLPLRNFGSQELNDMVSNIMVGAHGAENLEKLIKDAIVEFNRSARTHRPDGAPREYYCNADGLVFVPPGNQTLHGLVHGAQEGNGHLTSCYVNGRVRLGGSFNPRFHYDCSPMRGRLKSHYQSCHGQDVSPKASTHVNIGPNDGVR